MTERCERCGGLLFMDRHAQADLARAGYIGGRIYCALGCTDVWLKMRRVPPAAGDAQVPERRGTYRRRPRRFRCGVCHQMSETRGTRTRRCAACQIAQQRARERGRYRRRVTGAA